MLCDGFSRKNMKLVVFHFSLIFHTRPTDLCPKNGLPMGDFGNTKGVRSHDYVFGKSWYWAHGSVTQQLIYHTTRSTAEHFTTVRNPSRYDFGQIYLGHSILGFRRSYAQTEVANVAGNTRSRPAFNICNAT